VATLALVHGAWHGAWCWDRLIPELERRGHRAIAMDLPSDDPKATFDTYADVVADQLEAAEGDGVVVGHSLAGLTIPLVPARQRVSRLVYLCALVPLPGSSFMQQLETEQDMLNLGYVAGLGETDAEGRRGWVDRGLARDILYADCDPKTTEEALDRLRPQAQTPFAKPCSLDGFPATPSTYIVCDEDRLVMPGWSRSVARERLGADVVELPGGHSPFLSRPDELANALHDAALAPRS
jgi:pimeloyl-ACP methyl ester carboxylesterase